MILRADTSFLSLNGQVAPGIFESLSIGSKLLVDSKAVDGGSGKQYQVNGFDDASLSFSLRLMDDENTSKEEALGALTRLFKKFDDSGKPALYKLDFPQASAWNLQDCLFLSLDSSQAAGRQEIKVSLKFAEYRPEIARVQEQKQGSSRATSLSDAPTAPVLTEQEEIDIRLERTR